MGDAIATYRRAFASSSCCDASLFRVIRRGEPDLYVCQQCAWPCDAVPDPLLAGYAEMLVNQRRQQAKGRGGVGAGA